MLRNFRGHYPQTIQGAQSRCGEQAKKSKRASNAA